MKTVPHTIKLLIIPTAFLLFTGCPDKTKAKGELTEPAKDTTAMVDSTKTDSGTALSEADIQAQKLESRRKNVEDMINKIMTDDVYFDFDKTGLTEKARDLLAQVGDILQAEKQFKVVVEGHTDKRGTEAYNLSLGGKRAGAVQKYLIDYGVDSSRISSMSFGEEKPKVEGESEDAFSQNRRAHFRVLISE